MVLKKSRIETILKYMFVITIILSSGAIVGYIYLNYIWIGQTLIGLVLLILCRTKNLFKIDRKNFITFLVVLMIVVINGFLISDASQSVIMALIMNVFALLLFVSNTGINEYREMYIKVMIVIAAVSLVMFILSQFGVLFRPRYVEATGGPYYVSFTYHIYCVRRIGVGVRNCGIFWEPGAYQAFLNLALLFCIKERKEYTIKDKIIITLFIVSVITTQSTTGYLTLAVIIIWNTFINPGDGANKVAASLIFLLVLLAVLNTSNLITDKLNMDNLSYMERNNDIVTGLQATLQKPILGWGFNSNARSDYLKVLGSNYPSSGIFNFSSMYGIPLTIICFWRMLEYLVAYTAGRNSRLKYLLLGIFLLIIFLTEHFMVKEIFLIFLFPALKDSNSIKLHMEEENASY